MRASTERSELLDYEEALVLVPPRQKERPITDELHADELMPLGSDLGWAGGARAGAPQMAIREDAVVTVTPIDPDGIPTHLAQLSNRRGRHQRNLLRPIES
jgi:hypothetical protein